MENQKNYFWSLLNVFLVAVIVGLVFFVLPAIAKFNDTIPPGRPISVSAEGKTLIPPDVALLNFSVLSRGKDPKVISEENTRKMNEVIAYVKGQGVEAKDIQTTGYNLQPNYEYDEKTRTSFISGYTLTQTVTVRIRDFSKISPVMGRLPELGVNQVGNISFTIDEPEKVLQAARDKAFEAARVKAEAMAKASGIKLGRVVSVSEYRYGGPSPYYAKERMLGMGGDALVAPQAAPSIEPGSEEVTLTATIVYEID